MYVQQNVQKVCNANLYSVFSRAFVQKKSDSQVISSHTVL